MGVRYLRHPILIDWCGTSDEAKVRAVKSWEKQMVRADEHLRHKDNTASEYSKRTWKRKLRKKYFHSQCKEGVLGNHSLPENYVKGRTTSIVDSSWTPLGLWLKPKAVFNTGRAQSRRPFRVQNLPGTLLGQKFKAGSQKPTSLL